MEIFLSIQIFLERKKEIGREREGRNHSTYILRIRLKSLRCGFEHERKAKMGHGLVFKQACTVEGARHVGDVTTDKTISYPPRGRVLKLGEVREKESG